MAYLIPLKAKHRIMPRRLLRRQFDPQEGTWVYNAGRFKSKTSNQGHGEKNSRTLAPRRKSYMGSVAH